MLLAALTAAPLSAAVMLEDKVTEFELDNGMKFIVIERHEAPVAFCAVGFRVGGIYERPGITGISHLLEHMLFKGTETLGTKDYEAEKEFLDREDELAEQIREFMLEIEPWRLEYFDEYVKELTSSFSEEDRQVIGSDRALELELLVEQLEEVGPADDMRSLSLPHAQEDRDGPLRHTGGAPGTHHLERAVGDVREQRLADAQRGHV
jgi:hypothetical protein